MTHIGYLLVGWGATLGVGVLYAFSLVRRGRRLARRVPSERRRWMSTGNE